MTTATTPVAPIDSVAQYLSSIGIYPLLTAQEEVELAQDIEAGNEAVAELESGRKLSAADRARVRRAIRRGEEARERFLNANLRLVVSQAKRYRRQSGIDFIDLIQEGNLGLIRAVDKFDWRKGFKFSTYATWWIRQAISRALAEKSRTLRIPGHLHDKLITLQAAKARYQAETGREPTPEELAEESGIDLPAVQEAIGVTESISLESPIGDDGATISDFVQGDDDDDNPVVLAERVAVSDDLFAAINRLGARERDILLTRFGFADGIPHTHEEIGKGYGLTPERIRQIEKTALSRLRHPSFGLLEDALF
jgi:RNA polymerase primary sigma factor